MARFIIKLALLTLFIFIVFGQHISFFKPHHDSMLVLYKILKGDFFMTTTLYSDALNTYQEVLDTYPLNVKTKAWVARKIAQAEEGLGKISVTLDKDAPVPVKKREFINENKQPINYKKP